jgi:hypothetical protein
MKIKGAFIISFFAIAACLVGFLAYSPSASAALDGENGPVLYTDNNVVDQNNAEKQEYENPVSQVITTAPDGTNEQVVATSEDKITAAGISGPTADNNYDIAYATESKDDCAKYEKTCAVVNKVTTNEDSSVTTSPEVLAELPSLVNGTKYNKSESWVNNLSYSPDGNTVLATQYSKNQLDILNLYGKSAVIAIDNETGTTTTIVGPTTDSYLNAGYADNGTIYYSKTTSLIPFNTDIWYITPDNPTPQQLTTSKNISEYFIDVSPDNSTVLVADVRSLTCLSAYGVLANRYEQTYHNCNYYLVSTADGTATQLSDLPKWFMPAYFSPDNTLLIGTLFSKNTPNLRALNSFSAVTATYNLSTNEIAVISDRVGVKQWAPKVVAAETETVVTQAEATPTVAVAKTTAATLPNTGVSVNSFVYLIASLLFVASLAIAPSILSNKK